VALEDTLTTAGCLPSERLDDWLGESLREPRATPAAAGGSRTVYPRGTPRPSRLDSSQTCDALDGMGDDLRRVVHDALGRDLAERGIAAERLDFSGARALERQVQAHGGRFRDLDGVRALDERGATVFEGGVRWLRDELAEEFHVFFGERIPEHVWRELDMGVRRRLAQDPRWKRDPRVVGNWS